ncbi:hypothetical protein BT69DRAFT_1298169 [Atractiella rhizophila]|nr:hypothetical protein BT69DRAFT_1298169 [Atractiella rhizophila]
MCKHYLDVKRYFDLLPEDESNSSTLCPSVLEEIIRCATQFHYEKDRLISQFHVLKDITLFDWLGQMIFWGEIVGSGSGSIHKVSPFLLGSPRQCFGPSKDIEFIALSSSLTCRAIVSVCGCSLMFYQSSKVFNILQSGHLQMIWRVVDKSTFFFDSTDILSLIDPGVKIKKWVELRYKAWLDAIGVPIMMNFKAVSHITSISHRSSLYPETTEENLLVDGIFSILKKKSLTMSAVDAIDQSNCWREAMSSKITIFIALTHCSI